MTSNVKTQESKTGAKHVPVLFHEVFDSLNIQPDGIYVDGTFGRGGHAVAMLKKLSGQGHLIVFDKDAQAIAEAQHLFEGDQRVEVIHDDFSQMNVHLDELNLHQQIDGILLDLGVSSPQLDQAERGFSFQNNGPLDMRMNTQQGEPASSWLQQAEENEIARVLWEYGEERYSRRIAAKIVEYRQQQNISDTHTLAALIKDCVPASKQQKKHPATRSFQAIRIHINQELEHLKVALESIFDVLKIGGRLLVISFHSLEDRLVKRFFKQHSSRQAVPRGLPLRDSEIQDTRRLKLIGKAIKAGEQELLQNWRARSAVLRVAERIA